MTMTGSEMPLNGLFPWVADLTANELDPTGITEAYWPWYKPEIMIKSLDDNDDVIFITENSWDPAEKAYPLNPWRSLTLDYNANVKTMNEFFITWTAWDILSVIVR